MALNKFRSLFSALWLTSCLVLFLTLLTSCSNSPVKVATPSVPIELTEIVDKSTQRPITDNTITLRWETSEGEVLDTQVYKNQSSLSTTLLADGDMRLWVKVEARGYKPWENAIRMKLNSSKPLFVEVEIKQVDVYIG